VNLRVGDRWRRVASLLPRRIWYAVCIGVLVIVAAVVWASSGSDAVSAAESLTTKGDMAGAKAMYEQVLAKNPNDARALDGLAAILLWQQKYDEAAVIEERAAASDDKNILVRLELGFNYLNHLDRSADAVRVFAEAATLEPSGKNLTFLAQARIASNDLAGAEEALRDAIAREPGYGYAYTVLVQLLTREGREDEASLVREAASKQGISVTG
jgi:tetratricopeptide (TPR) repeat protein